MTSRILNLGLKRYQNLSEIIRTQSGIGWRRQLGMVVMLSIPSILSQVSAVFMEYIDASMVGSLGADAAASIGLVSTTTWLFMGMCSAGAIGYSVQVAHQIGAGSPEKARSVLRQSLTATLIWSTLLAVIGAAISGGLPQWLGGAESIRENATRYFMLFSLALPALQMSFLTSGMLRSSGNMVVPGICGVLMCVLDVIFNFFLIFPSREVSLLGFSLAMPGAGLGVCGAAVGTAAAEIVTTAIMLWYLWRRGNELKLSGTRGSFIPSRATVYLSVPVTL